jgi:hypothetical protein
MAPVTRRTVAADGSAAEPATTAPPAKPTATLAATPRTGWVTVDETDDYDAPAPAPLLHLALLAVAVAPLLVPVPPNVAIVLTPTLAILAGAYRSVKEAPPSEQMTQKDAMRFPLVGRCVAAARGRARGPPRPGGVRHQAVVAAHGARASRRDAARDAASRTTPAAAAARAARRAWRTCRTLPAARAAPARTRQQPYDGASSRVHPSHTIDAACPAHCSAFLLGLFLLFKFLPKDLINAVLTGYFVLLVRPRRGCRRAAGPRRRDCRTRALPCSVR